MDSSAVEPIDISGTSFPERSIALILVGSNGVGKTLLAKTDLPMYIGILIELSADETVEVGHRIRQVLDSGRGVVVERLVERALKGSGAMYPLDQIATSFVRVPEIIAATEKAWKDNPGVAFFTVENSGEPEDISFGHTTLPITQDIASKQQASFAAALAEHRAIKLTN